MMNNRTRKPPASTIKGTASHQETPITKWIAHHSPRYGISVVVSCHNPRGTEGFWYLATISFHAGARDAPSFSVFKLVMVYLMQFLFRQIHSGTSANARPAPLYQPFLLPIETIR